MSCNHTPREHVASLVEMNAQDYKIPPQIRIMFPAVEKILTRLAMMDLFMMETEKENEFCEWIKRNLAKDEKEASNG